MKQVQSKSQVPEHLQERAKPFLTTMSPSTTGTTTLLMLKTLESRKLLVLSLLVGLCTGFVAVLLQEGIHLIKSLVNPLLDRNYAWSIVLPGIGMAISALLLRFVIKDNIGHGVTKVLVAQRVSSVASADLILVLSGGRVIARGTHETLLKTCELYQELYASQMGGLAQ